MARPEDGERQTSEKKLWVNPEDLLRNNPAALIVNPVSYKEIEQGFSLELFQEPWAVWVMTSSGKQLKIVDGLTRVIFAFRNQEKVFPQYPGFSLKTIVVKDITQEIIRNPLYVLPEERKEGQEFLTPLQYLRAVIPRTVEHTRIAPDRIASHLLNSWDQMVGEDLAERFSCLAALGILNNPRISTLRGEQLKTILRRQKVLLTGETVEERSKLEIALSEMDSIISLTGQHREEVNRSAFELVSAESPVIGGERTMRREIFGLLNSPLVEEKLLLLFSETVIREQARIELGEVIFNAFKRLAPESKKIFLGGFQKALSDENLSWLQLRQIFQSASPLEKYREITRQINVERVTKRYSERGELGPLAKLLIERLVGGEDYLFEGDVYFMAREIRTAVDLRKQANKMGEDLKTQEKELLREGVRGETINQALANINSLVKNLEAAETLGILAKRKGELDFILLRVREKILFEKVSFMVEKTVGKVYADFLAKFGPQIKAGIVNFILQTVDLPRQPEKFPGFRREVERILGQLRSLDGDLQTEVVNGEVSLAFALQRQRERQEMRVEKRQTEKTVPAKEGVTVAPPPLLSVEGQLLPESKVAFRERRIEIGNQRLLAAIRKLLESIELVDLKPKELDLETKRAIDELLQKIGQLRFGHPDLVRVMEEYPWLQEKLVKLQEVLVQQEARKTIQLTKTGR